MSNVLSILLSLSKVCYAFLFLCLCVVNTVCILLHQQQTKHSLGNEKVEMQLVDSGKGLLFSVTRYIAHTSHSCNAPYPTRVLGSQALFFFTAASHLRLSSPDTLTPES